jgi:hypothetical protein
MGCAGRAFVLRTGAFGVAVGGQLAGCEPLASPGAAFGQALLGVGTQLPSARQAGAPVRRTGGDPCSPWPSGPFKHRDKEPCRGGEAAPKGDAPLHSVEGVAGVETPAGGGGRPEGVGRAELLDMGAASL